MKYEKEIYSGFLMKGSLLEAVDYLRQFPEKNNLVKRYEKRFNSNKPVKRSENALVNELDAIFQEYYKMIFWKKQGRQESVEFLYNKLLSRVGEEKLRQFFEDTFHEKAEEMYQDMEMRLEGIDELLTTIVEKEGYHYIGGRTQGYFGPYIWKETKPETYQVSLPIGNQSFTVQMMKDFISRSWLDYISFGKIGTGGWAVDGQLFCVEKSYEKDKNKPKFQISFLKHEAQHVYDKNTFPKISAMEMEYRAKLVELIYYPSICKFHSILSEADNSDKNNTHCYASYLIVRNLSRLIFEEEYVADYSRWKRRLKKVQECSRICYDAYPKMDM